MRILIISHYPFEIPLHGGQIRISNIVRTYRNAGFDVDAIGTSYNYPYAKNFIGNIDANTINRYTLGCPVMDDYGIGQAFFKENSLFERLAHEVKNKPDVIEIVQPWFFDFANRLRNDYFNAHIPIIYSSQNVEYALKESILKNFFGLINIDEAINAIKNLEIRTISQSDGIICVSSKDQEWISGYTDAPIILAPNGVSDWHSSEAEVENIKRKMKGNKFALFCGSAHPPNLTGFFDMLDGGFGSLDTGQKLIAAGSICQLIENDPRFLTSAKLRDRTKLLGLVSDDLLHALLDLAQCIILPITQGGGTNLKTAEALWAGHHIVATTVAMRGFEKFMHQRGVEIADEPGAFKRALRKAMEADPLVLNDAERKVRKEVLWDSYLKGLPDFVKKIVRDYKK